MPPRKSSRTAAAQPLPLVDCHIALSGTFPGTSQAAIQDQIISCGASVSKSITTDTTHLVASQRDFDKPSTKVKAAQEHNLQIVGIEWIENCFSTISRALETPYLFASSASVPPQSNGPQKRNASPDSDADKPKSRVKKQKTDNDIKNEASDSENEVNDTKAKANGSKTKANGSKAKAKDSKAEAKDSKADVKKGKIGDGQIAKSSAVKIPIDEQCHLYNYEVYIDDKGVIYDASLNQANATANNNKFYRLQVLQSPINGDFRTWSRWGRVGERGQSANLGDGTLENALLMFEKKFKDKSSLKWSDRGKDPRPGKYAFIERNYEDSDDEDDDAGADKKDESTDKIKEEPESPESTLPPATQDLMGLIFNQDYFAATMTELNYDANKLPLGKLSKATITRGFQALKDLSAILDDHLLASSYDMSYADITEHFSNLYYTIIPHAFGRNRPPIIRSSDLLKKEIELLESLGDMKDAALIMKTKNRDADEINALDRQFQGLGMEELTPLDHKGSEFKELKTYLHSSRGATHNVNYSIQEIFRVERQGEKDRFEKSDFASAAGDRRLLWHGSRCTNFAGILSQGLRIAPPEAPVSGYMFGKGIYLADMSTKSAGYCCPYISGGQALLLLCEAELGAPMQSLTDCSYSAAEDAKSKGLLSTWGQGTTGPSTWKDADCVHPSLAGVNMPDMKVQPGPTDVKDASLLYNEYICYDVAQVRLRYLFRVKM